MKSLEMIVIINYEGLAMRKTTLLIIIALLLFGCTSSKGSVPRTTPTQKPTSTRTQKPTQTPKPATPTATPYLRDLRRAESAFGEAFSRYNNVYGEDGHLLSVAYQGGTIDEPTLMVFKVQDNTDENHEACFFPIVAISSGILLNSSIYSDFDALYPRSLDSFKVECYTSTSKLKVSYTASVATIHFFTSQGKIDGAKLNVITDNLPTFTPEVTSTPEITSTASRMPTRPPIPSSTQQSSGGITAICKDGSASYSKHVSGTCAGHGGVSQWINKPLD
jgi:hypothetical protein